MKYDELKKSPLGKKDVEPEEVAIWLEMHNYASASKMIEILRCIETHYHVGIADHVEEINTSSPTCYITIFKNIAAGYASDIILKNLFMILVKHDLLSLKELQKLLVKVSKRKDAIRKKCSCSIHTYSWRRDIDLLEVFAELEERLEDKLKHNYSCDSTLVNDNC